MHVKDEFAFIENYLSLQTIQSEHSFDYKIDIYPSYDNVLIPFMILQPFVENAIVHAFTPLSGKGHLLIRVTRGKHTLHCIIEDNGPGLHDPDNDTIRSTHALAVTRQRLTLLQKKTGQSATFDISDKNKEEGPGVRVTIEIPIQPGSTVYLS